MKAAAAKDMLFEAPPVEDGVAVRVIGKVRVPLALTFEDLKAMDVEEIGELSIICGTGTPKGSIHGCKGVLLEEVVRKADVVRDEDDDTKKMFLIVSAFDGYKVVFSWQEIFNSAMGGGVMILLEKNGRPLDPERGGLELLSAEDYFTGARYVKGLRTVEVAMA
jgi:DMSO/TMAO reductase YedYZ molybdopterin-dependent catalytic subunit